jgi:hypothetical protein
MANELDEAELSRGTSVTYGLFAGLASKYQIQFKHIASGNTVNFPAILTDFADTWNSSWDEQEYFGRMDPIARFKNTRREITIGFACVADDGREASEYLSRFQKLVKFLYPSYRKADDQAIANKFQSTGVSTLASPPIIGIKLCNMIQSPKQKVGGGGWLIGYTDGFGLTPDESLGWFLADGFDNAVAGAGFSTGPGVFDFDIARFGTEATKSREGRIMLPKKFEVSFTFKVLHTQELGWSEDGQWFGTTEGGNGGDYPYNAHDIAGTLPDEEPLMGPPVYSRIKVAKVPKSVKKGVFGAMFGALFGPPK